PYRKNLLNSTLQGLLKRNWLAPGALICAEIEKDAAVAAPDSLELLVERHFGQTRILIWTLA
ncbi:MAG: RsmD family RNA methyltransferase, partial [Desulfovibrio piger]